MLVVPFPRADVKIEPDPTPPPPYLPSPPPSAPAIHPIEIIPASRAKRRPNFELIIEVPAKRFRASHYPVPSPAISPDKSTTHQRKKRDRTHRSAVTRELASTPFKVTLDPNIRSIGVTREFLCTQFDVKRVSCSRLAYEVHKHGYDHFAFLHEVRTISFASTRPFINSLHRNPHHIHLSPPENPGLSPTLKEEHGQNSTLTGYLCASS